MLRQREVRVDFHSERSEESKIFVQGNYPQPTTLWTPHSGRDDMRKSQNKSCDSRNFRKVALHARHTVWQPQAPSRVKRLHPTAPDALRHLTSA